MGVVTLSIGASRAAAASGDLVGVEPQAKSSNEPTARREKFMLYGNANSRRADFTHLVEMRQTLRSAVRKGNAEFVLAVVLRAIAVTIARWSKWRSSCVLTNG